ncbi:MAG: ABC transporter ATP-binding protein [Candidatus Thorarchaeota archaeon]
MSGTGEYLLKIENLRAFHSSKEGLVRAVNDVSFGIKKGECVGLLGESGAGKSSVALSILGLFERQSRYYASSAKNKENRRLWSLRDQARKEGKTSEEMGVELPGVEGHIWFDGKDILNLDEKEHSDLIGTRITYVPQGTSKALNPLLSIETQVLEVFWAKFRDEMRSNAKLSMKVLEELDLVELGDMAIRRDMLPVDFSTGEDQRVLLAMALISKPDLVIADEPTTALDTAVRHKILSAIMRASKELEQSILMISNDPSIITATCSKVGVMSSGMMMEFGDTERVMNEPLHPFTQAFLMSNPTFEMMRQMRQKGERLRPIPGRPPSLLDLPTGCPFNTRCSKVEDICKEKRPDYREVEPGHWVFCHMV